jgi:transposase
MTTLQLTHQRVDDIPLLLAMMIEMGIPEKINQQIQPHGHWQGLNVGLVVTIWLSYILTEQDHRLVAVREWVAERKELFNRLLGIELRDTDLTDDRLANVLMMLGDEVNQEQLDISMVQDWITLYELPTEITRYDSTTVSVYHDSVNGDGLLGYGHSKDHRPDLAQFKVMLSTLDPLGLPLTCELVNGKRADDKLYIPSYDKTVETIGHSHFLAIGDSKMGAIATRAHFASQGSFYLCPLRDPAAKGVNLQEWIEQALSHKDEWQVVEKPDPDTGEIKQVASIYSWMRPQSVSRADGETFSWQERVLVTQSLALQEGMTTKREAQRQQAYTALDNLSRPPKQGQKRYRSAEVLQAEVDKLLDKYHLRDLVSVRLTGQPHTDGGQRWIVQEYQCDEAAWQKMLARLGWQCYVSNMPADRYSDPQLVLLYRQQPYLERGIARLKSRYLHIRPVFLRDEQRIAGLTWLLLLALRVMVLMEFRVRRQLAQRQESIVGLNPASKTQATNQPTTDRLLKAFGNITFSIAKLGDQVHYHISELTPTQKHILSLLDLPDDIYLRLAHSQPKPLFNLRES